MTNNGAKINKIKIKKFDKNNRGVVSTHDIKAGEEVLFIPSKLMISDEYVLKKSPISQNSPLVSKLKFAGLFETFEDKDLQRLHHPYQAILTLFLMEQRRLPKKEQ